MSRRMKQLLTILMSVALVFTMVPGGNYGFADSEHSCSYFSLPEGMQWTKLTSETHSLEGDSYYYLAEDVTMNHDLILPQDSSAYLCLNGKNLSFTGNSLIKGDMSFLNCGNCGSNGSITADMTVSIKIS